MLRQPMRTRSRAAARQPVQHFRASGASLFKYRLRAAVVGQAICAAATKAVLSSGQFDNARCRQRDDAVTRSRARSGQWTRR